MSASLTVFAMTRKGLEVVDFISTSYPDVLKKVVIGRDRAIAEDCADALETLCKTRSIPYAFRGQAAPVDTGYALAVSWRWLIDVEEQRLIILHDSLLPRYRGFAPLVNALINGEEEIGVTALFGVTEYDRGDIIAQSRSHVAYPITIAQAIEQVTANYLEVAGAVCECLARSRPLTRRRQREEHATYSIWRDGDDYRIDWTMPADRIRRFIDAVGYPYAGAKTHDGQQTIVVDAAEEVPDVRCEIRDVGKVIFVRDGSPVVICGSGLLRITSARALAADGTFSACVPMQRFRVRFR